MFQSKEYEIIPFSFFQREDVVEISKQLVGMYLFHDAPNGMTGGRIVETEAYNGRRDKACHAFLKRTKRTEVMYREGGTAYIYLCYGIHHLFNIVTNVEGMADAVLVRALEPVIGTELMRERTGKSDDVRKLASGPGMVGKAMGFHKDQTGTVLGQEIFVARKLNAPPVEVRASARIGVDYAGEDALLPWRFLEDGSAFVSRK